MLLAQAIGIELWSVASLSTALLAAAAALWLRRADTHRRRKLQQSNHDLRSQLDDQAARLSALHEKLNSRTELDGLTEMLTRRAFTARLDQTIARLARTPDRCGAMLFINLDRFKQINDIFGHQVGDMMIGEFADRLRRVVDQLASSAADVGAVVGRMGGDEFVVLIEHREAAALADDLADRIDACLAEPFRIGDRTIFASVCIGVVRSSVSFTDAATTIRDADHAMHAAKRDGGSRTVIFDQQMKQELHDRIVLQHELADALDAGQLQLYYQPIVDLRTGRAAGFEVLTRWFHPQRGAVSPARFIPLAEHSGLILKLGQWVLEEGCRQLAAWSADPDVPDDLTLSVNVSPMQFATGDFAMLVRRVLAETGLSAERLHIEITESTFMADTPTTRRTLAELQAIGVSLNMDDFGTGYSSLSSLHRLPVDTIKIDRSFIAPMLQQRNCLAVVKAITDLAHNVGMRVVAEGIEETAQIERLQQIGCDYGQGYAFGKPTPANEALRIINHPLLPPELHRNRIATNAG